MSSDIRGSLKEWTGIPDVFIRVDTIYFMSQVRNKCITLYSNSGLTFSIRFLGWFGEVKQASKLKTIQVTFAIDIQKPNISQDVQRKYFIYGETVMISMNASSTSKAVYKVLMSVN